MTVQAETVAQVQEVQKTNTEDRNFAALRKQAEAERKARLEAEARIAELERLTAQKRDEDDSDDEPYVDHRKLEKTLSKFESNLEKKIDERAEMRARVLLDQERQNSYLKENHDFEATMSPENVQRFAEKHPRLAEGILRMPDGFERQKLVYETIKAMGLDKAAAKEPSIQEKINANRRSPFMPSNGMSGPGYSTGGDFSESGQKNAYQQMKQLSSRLRLG